MCGLEAETEISCDMMPIHKKTTWRDGAPVVIGWLAFHVTGRITQSKNFFGILLNLVLGPINMDIDTSSSLGRGLSLVTAG